VCAKVIGHSQLPALGRKFDDLVRRFDKLEERALRSDEAATLRLLDKELRRQRILETGANPDVAEAIANDPNLAEAMLKYLRDVLGQSPR
jgi:hypothetical protein